MRKTLLADSVEDNIYDSVLKALKDSKVISLETTLMRILLTGSNKPVVESSKPPVYSDTAFNNYENQLKENFEAVVRFVLEAPYCLGKQTKDNRLFILAKLASFVDEKEIASYALNKAIDICVDAEDVLTLACFITYFRGFGRMVKKVLARWYVEREPRDLVGEVMACRKKTITTIDDSGQENQISFSHRTIVRRLHLRGSDDLQDACFRIIKGYRGNASEVPERFLTYRGVCSLSLYRKGSLETACSLISGLPFDYNAYPREVRLYPQVKQVLFYEGHLPFQVLMEDLLAGKASYLSDKLVDRTVHILMKQLKDELIVAVDLLRVRRALDPEQYPETRRMLSVAHKEYAKTNREETTLSNDAVFLVLSHNHETNKIIALDALERAKSMNCNLVILGKGTFALNPADVTVDELEAALPKFDEKDKLMTSTAFIQVLGSQPIAYDRVVVYEWESTLLNKENAEGFLNVLDTYLTGRNPSAKIVHQVVSSDSVLILNEPRHNGLLTVVGNDTTATKLVDIFLER